MDARVKKLWVDALRNGGYKQGRDYLRSSDDAFCCLGVLCDIHSKEVADLWSKENDDDEDYTYDGNPGTLPSAVSVWAGIYHIDGNPLVPCDDPIVWTGKSSERSLTECNDDLEYTFRQIADLIEDNL